MMLLSRLLGIWAVGKTFSLTTPLFMRLILTMAVITLMAIFTAVIFTILTAGSIWLIYGLLIDSGVAMNTAVACIGLGLIGMMLAIVAVMQFYWRRACDFSKKIMYLSAPTSTRVSGIADAFMNGYNAR